MNGWDRTAEIEHRSNEKDRGGQQAGHKARGEQQATGRRRERQTGAGQEHMHNAEDRRGGEDQLHRGAHETSMRQQATNEYKHETQ